MSINISTIFNYIDIGSRDGIDIEFERFKKNINFIGFDPGEEHIENTPAKFGFNSVTIINKAIWSENTIKTFYITKSPYNCSLRKPDFDTLEAYHNPDRFQVISNEEVQCIQLNDVLNMSPSVPSFIKIDAQGCTYDIISTLDFDSHFINLLGMQVEASFICSYVGERSFSEINQLLINRGYLLIDLDSTYWKPNLGKNFSGVKGVLIYADLLYLPSFDMIRKLLVNKSKGEQESYLLSLKIVCSCYGLKDYFNHAVLSSEEVIGKSICNKICFKENKWGVFAFLSSISKSFFISSLLREIADLLHQSRGKYSFTTHSFCNRPRSYRLRWLRDL